MPPSLREVPRRGGGSSLVGAHSVRPKLPQSLRDSPLNEGAIDIKVKILQKLAEIVSLTRFAKASLFEGG
jgi:hypothetical protein